MIGQLSITLLMASTIVTAAIFDLDVCMNQHNAICNSACWSNRQYCYLHNWQNVCPCVMKCYRDHCMDGIMGEVCPACAFNMAYCRLWHHRIELYTCGDKKLDSKTALKSHCSEFVACIRSCPNAAQCTGSDIHIHPDGIPMPEVEVQFK